MRDSDDEPIGYEHMNNSRIKKEDKKSRTSLANNFDEKSK
jgi:hypothetical protein